MFKLDDELIKDRFTATSYNFYNDEEIKRLSVKQILNPTAFDHLGNANNGGIYDKTMGVSPFDHRAQCVTCGLDSNFCPGHMGHIELTAPIYNPFLINHLYKLLKSKCVHCHRIRIHPSKIDIFVKCLKLIKSGDIVASNTLKTFFLHAAKQIQLINDSHFEDPKKMESVKIALNKMVFGNLPKDQQKMIDDKQDIGRYFKSLEMTLNNMKKDKEAEIINMMNIATQTDIPIDQELDNDIARCGHSSIIQKMLKETIHEIWAQIVPISCPHCNGKSPNFRKDGYTKFFQKALSEKVKSSMKQAERLSKASDKGVKDDAFEIITEASTAGITHSRKESHTDQQSAGAYDDIYSETANDMEEEDEEEEKGGDASGKQKYISPIEVKDHIKRFWEKERELLELIFGRYYANNSDEPYQSDSFGPNMFFMEKLLVPPNRFRPESQGAFGGAGGASGDKAYLHAHSAMITKILTINLALKDALLQKNEDGKEEKSGGVSEVVQKWIQLQDGVNTFLDSSMASKTAEKEQNGLRQLLERKEGMFRMKMMGKRVNFGARSVISPDPYITTDQIGVPVFMARKLTFPESVSLVNAEKLRKLVMNGPHQHPGANIIEDEDTGVRTHLETLNFQQRKGLAHLLTVGKKVVYRHLDTGDVLLVNRQPTLHKPSIMAHVARILPKEQTIRMHYANCSTYNADFDGDEMNLHFPQSYQACSEAYKLMATHKQYIVPTSGKPIRGLIQDSVVSGVFLTSKDTFLNKETYQQLVYVGLRELIEDEKLPRIFTMQPTILKPQPLWTGKQVISTILKNIVNQDTHYKLNKLSGMNLDSKAKLSAKEWGPIGKEEGEVVIRDNELLQGTLDKNQFGSNEFGMVHSFYEIYGSEKAGDLLTALARIFTVYLQMHGFTCGLDDLVLTPKFNKERRLLIEKCHKEGVEAAAEFCGLKNHQANQYNYSNRVVFQSGEKAAIDKDVKKYTRMAIPENPFENKQCVQEDDPIRKRLEEKMNSTEDTQKMDSELDSAIRNKMSNATSQVLKLCLPDGLMKRFPKNNIAAMVLTGAKGGIVNMAQISAMLGQQELEGKRVPKMQNGKTLPCYLPYDPNPRSSGYVTDRFITGLRPQDFYFHCMAGREGLIDTAVKTSRSGYLQRCLIKQLEALIVNYDMTVRDNDGSIVQFLYGEDGIDVMNTKFLDQFHFLEQNFTSLITNYNGGEIIERVDCESVDAYKQKSKKMLKRQNKVADPVISKHHPLKYFGAISESMDQQLNSYLENDCNYVKTEALGAKFLKSKFKPIKGETFKKMYFLKYMKSVADPGENVGTIAAQSVGEPSTQMTLNTFHLAGHGAGNMTLGIPRLKEILMTTPTNIKTPMMTVHFRKECNMKKEEMEAFANKFKRLKLSDLTKEVKVNQSISQDEHGTFSRLYQVTIEFEDMKKIKKQLNQTFEQLIKVVSDQFVPLLMNETLRQLKKAQGTTKDMNEEETKTVATKTSQAKPRAKKPQTKNKVGNEEGEDFLENEEELLRKESSHKSRSKKDEDEDEDEEEEEAEADYNSDIDGPRKQSKALKGQGQEDEDDQDIKRKLSRQNVRASENAEDQSEEEDEKLAKHCNLIKEKLIKYVGYLKGMTYDKEKSVTVTISFPLEFKKVLMLTVAESILSKVLIRSIHGIEKCLLISPDKEKQSPYLIVQGINFDAFYQYAHIVDVNRIETNDIWAVKKKYGIEASRANIVKEIRTVFGMYGIEVNYRHLSLISDFITFNGEYRAFNRIGMEESSSPFLKMSFETTMRYLIGSCLTKDTDDMSTPSSSLVLGQVPKVGTGIFDLIQDPEYTLQ